MIRANGRTPETRFCHEGRLISFERRISQRNARTSSRKNFGHEGERSADVRQPRARQLEERASELEKRVDEAQERADEGHPRGDESEECVHELEERADGAHPRGDEAEECVHELEERADGAHPRGDEAHECADEAQQRADEAHECADEGRPRVSQLDDRVTEPDRGAALLAREVLYERDHLPGRYLGSGDNEQFPNRPAAVRRNHDFRLHGLDHDDRVARLHGGPYVGRELPDAASDGTRDRRATGRDDRPARVLVRDGRLGRHDILSCHTPSLALRLEGSLLALLEGRDRLAVLREPRAIRAITERALLDADIGLAVRERFAQPEQLVRGDRLEPNLVEKAQEVWFAISEVGRLSIRIPNLESPPYELVPPRAF